MMNEISLAGQGVVLGYRKRELDWTLKGGEDAVSPPTACLVLPLLDQGIKLFRGKSRYKSIIALSYLLFTLSIFGFFANRVLGKLDGTLVGPMTGGGVINNMLHGNSSMHCILQQDKTSILLPPKGRGWRRKCRGHQSGGGVRVMAACCQGCEAFACIQEICPRQCQLIQHPMI